MGVRLGIEDGVWLGIDVMSAVWVCSAGDVVEAEISAVAVLREKL
jgi:hypothetical protein